MDRKKVYQWSVASTEHRVTQLGTHLMMIKISLNMPPEELALPIKTHYSEKDFSLAIQAMQRVPDIKHKRFLSLLENGPPATNIALEDSYGRGEKSLEDYAWSCFAIKPFLEGLFKAIKTDDKNLLENYECVLAGLTDATHDVLRYGAELAGYWTAQLERRRRDYSRTEKSRAAVKGKKAQDKQDVVEAFHRAPNIDKATRPHTIAKAVHEYLRTQKQPINIRSLNTIKNYLREEKLI